MELNVKLKQPAIAETVHNLKIKQPELKGTKLKV
jgi:hypothetical protein